MCSLYMTKDSFYTEARSDRVPKSYVPLSDGYFGAISMSGAGGGSGAAAAAGAGSAKSGTPLPASSRAACACSAAFPPTGF